MTFPGHPETTPVLRHVLWSTTALRRDHRGVTQIEDAILAAVLGVDMLGAVAFMRDGTQASLDATTVTRDGAAAQPGAVAPTIWLSPDLGALLQRRPSNWHRR
ncbi:hypothetical protein [Sabulicella glaciei]|uniref:Uncharacterized protein n=1 Tax=Sabulicella glaciei TaxID=2984948 RepID=A0ABT3NZG4_9PROT|nr:hypothetical protein [Roseococcus sp. MDT2-1-1]MCW8087562.1 hypothetical protein [Roseococcus sp. MDT2-1-1]